MEYDESLLCNEVWPSSPVVAEHHHRMKYQKKYCGSDCGFSSMYTTMEDYEEAFTICSEKEMSYMPQSNYSENLTTNNLVTARFGSIQWFIKATSRLNLSLETVFYAANYFDRFVSMNHCIGWKYWMVELLSVACLSIATKFNDTYTRTLLEIQMEDLDHLFESSTIQRMEMMVLEALGWRLASTTAYSYLELLLTWILDSLKPSLHEEFIARLNKLLLRAISDKKLLEFRPSVIALSALRCNLKKSLSPASDANLHCILISLLDHDRKVELVKCQKIMEEQSVVDDSLYNLIPRGLFHHCPSSPTTVLLKARIKFSDYLVDFSLFKMRDQNIEVESTVVKKRKRRRKKKNKTYLPQKNIKEQ